MFQYVWLILQILIQFLSGLKVQNQHRSLQLTRFIQQPSATDNMRAELCVETLKNARLAYPKITGAIIHSDRGGQYTSETYREAIKRYEIQQSMNSAGG